MPRRPLFTARVALLAPWLLATALLALLTPAVLADSWAQVPATQRSVNMRVPPQLGGTGSATGASAVWDLPNGAPVAVNCNSTGDTPFALPSASAYYRLSNLWAVGESGTFTTAKVGIYTAPSQGGNTLLAQTVLSAITTTAHAVNGAYVALSPVPTAILAGGTTLYLNVGTAQGGTCAANFYIAVTPLPNG
jgi:hypothetical protein